MEIVYCIAEFAAKDGRREEMIKALEKLEEPTHEEAGCMMYQVMLLTENTNATGNGADVIMNETWLNEELFNDHNRSQHIKEFFKKECLERSGSVKQWNVRLFKSKNGNQ